MERRIQRKNGDKGRGKEGDIVENERKDNMGKDGE